MTIRFGYYADLRSIQLDENGRGWIQAMRVGDYKHPVHGKLSFTLDRLHRFAESVRSKVRGIDCDIDYDHKLDPTKGREAAGWVKDAKVEGDTLYLLVDWTKTALEKIKEKAYRYFSPEFQDEWTDANGKKHQDVLFGGGITNRPFLKDLLPLNLSELSFADNPHKEEGVDPKQLRSKLGLPEDATDEQVLERLTNVTAAAQSHGGTTPNPQLTTAAPNAPATIAPPANQGTPADATTAGQVDKDGNSIAGQATPFDKQLSELAATNPLVAKMLSDQAAMQKQLSELALTNKKNAIKIKLGEYSTGNKIVSPVILTEAEKLLTAMPEPLHELVHNLLGKVREGLGTVQLGETGGASTSTGTSRADGKAAEDVVEERVKKMLSEDKDLVKADAYTKVFAEDPQLFVDYQQASYAFKA